MELLLQKLSLFPFAKLKNICLSEECGPLIINFALEEIHFGVRYIQINTPRLLQEKTAYFKKMESKVFNDIIHGHMVFHPLLVILIDTPQMQRLRNLKQLGVCYFVYPSASHNRFEHSLGTAHIAGQLMDHLKKGQNLNSKEEETWEKNKLCVQIAGLCHDIGHGPFSHTWELFRRKIPSTKKWLHEKESVIIFDQMLDENISPKKQLCLKKDEKLKVIDAFEFYGLKSDDINFIKDVILGGEKYRLNKNNYLYQIVCNRINDIDVDKWDYLMRDSKMLNFPISFDYKRLLYFCRLLKVNTEEGEKLVICYRKKECSALVDMFLARGNLHDKAYQHTKVKIIEEMLLDALKYANISLKFTERDTNQLTDHIYQEIKYCNAADENIQKAKEIIKRIESRNLYKCLIKESYEDQIPSSEEIKKVLDNCPLKEDVFFTIISFDMTASNRYEPLKNVHVYNKEVDNEVPTTEKFQYDKYKDSLKPDLTKLRRRQVLILYRGTEEVTTSQIDELRKQIQSIPTGQK